MKIFWAAEFFWKFCILGMASRIMLGEIWFSFFRLLEVWIISVFIELFLRLAGVDLAS